MPNLFTAWKLLNTSLRFWEWKLEKDVKQLRAVVYAKEIEETKVWLETATEPRVDRTPRAWSHEDLGVLSKSGKLCRMMRQAQIRAKVLEG